MFQVLDIISLSTQQKIMVLIRLTQLLSLTFQAQQTLLQRGQSQHLQSRSSTMRMTHGAMLVTTQLVTMQSSRSQQLYQKMYQLMTSIHTQFVTSSAMVLHSIITLLTNTMTLAAMRSLLLQQVLTQLQVLTIQALLISKRHSMLLSISRSF